MTEREYLNSEIVRLEELIKDSQKSIRETQVKIYQLCDDVSTYKEGREDVLISSRPKKFENKLIGRVFWTQYFEDEDTGQKIAIDRKRIVREDNKWFL